MPEENKSSYLEHAAEIVISYVAKNGVPADQVAPLISAVHAALAQLGQPPAAETESGQRLSPAQIKKTISPDYLVSLEDGRRYKSLKRHLGRLGLTPEAYRQKWGLPSDYPMVAPAYSATRSELARKLGLGSMRKKQAAPPPAKRTRSRRSASTEVSQAVSQEGADQPRSE